jgi:hypothetical protein
MHTMDRVRKRVSPPRGGVVLKEVHSLDAIPKHFWQHKAGFCLPKFMKTIDRESAHCYGVFFGRSGDSEVRPPHFNFAVFARDRFGTRHGFLSKRPFTDGSRHIFVSVLDKKAIQLWNMLRFWAFRIGRVAYFVNQLYHHVLSPDGPALKRARHHFEQTRRLQQ